MATRIVWTPEAGYQLPASNYPALTQDATTRHIVLCFDAATDETVILTGVAPQGLTGALTLVIFFRMASAVSGNVVLKASVEAITPGDAVDTDTASSFDTVNNSAATAVPGTAGFITSVSITLTNNDTMAAGDMLRIEVGRAASNAGDTATGDLCITRVELRDAA